MVPVRLASLAEVFVQIPDPRKLRGVHHPLQGILTLVFLGLLARIRETGPFTCPLCRTCVGCPWV